MMKYDSDFLSMTQAHLTVPSPKANAKLIGRYRSRRGSSRLSSANTAAYTDSRSALSTSVADNTYDSEIEFKNIKISDLLNKTIDCTQRSGSKIRRDMCGNLRSVPEHRLHRVHRRNNISQVNGTDHFIIIRPEQDISPLLDPHKYVDDIIYRLSRSQDPRPINRYRQKFSEKHKTL